MIRRAARVTYRWWMAKTNPVRFARELGVQIGNDCRLIGVSASTFGSEPYLVKIGDHVTVTGGVRFVTHDGGVWVFRHIHPDLDVVAPITIGDNVFIGLNAILLPGVNVGNNSVIGAGAVVTRDIPSDCVAVGVPARPICSIEAYWRKVEQKALFIRSLPQDEKRALLRNRFLGSAE